MSAHVTAELPECAVARFSGPLAEGSLQEVAQSFADILGERIRNLVIDCVAIDDLSPEGIGLFLTLRATLRKRGGELILTGLRPRLERLLTSLDLMQLFTIAADEQAALQFLRNPGGGMFPLAANCPACAAQIEVGSPGRGRCASCQAVITALPDGSIILG